jgi:pteridine reductase
MRKSQRVALVTGGAKRVGHAIVLRLLKAGFDVAFTYHSSRREANDLLNRQSPALQGRRPFLIAIRADLTKPQTSTRTIFKTLTNSFDRLDVLVNNASIYSEGDDDLTDMFAIHVQSPLLLCRAFEPMLRKSRGRVVNMLDLLAERPWPKYASYCATKAALWSLTLSLARELAPQVTVNGIAPGVVDWPADTSATMKRKYLQRVPLKRAGAPGDVASLVHFLATEGAYITGQVIRLDGGRSLM